MRFRMLGPLRRAAVGGSAAGAAHRVRTTECLLREIEFRCDGERIIFAQTMLPGDDRRCAFHGCANSGTPRSAKSLRRADATLDARAARIQQCCRRTCARCAASVLPSEGVARGTAGASPVGAARRVSACRACRYWSRKFSCRRCWRRSRVRPVDVATCGVAGGGDSMNVHGRSPGAAQPPGRDQGSSSRFPVHRIYCVARNYAAHAREMGADPEREPPCFLHASPRTLSCRTAPRCPIRRARRTCTTKSNWSSRSASAGRQISQLAAALDHVFGYAVGNDLTRRDLQAAAKAKGMPWDVAKGFDAFGADHVRSGRLTDRRSLDERAHLARGRTASRARMRTLPR